MYIYVLAVCSQSEATSRSAGEHPDPARQLAAPSDVFPCSSVCRRCRCCRRCEACQTCAKRVGVKYRSEPLTDCTLGGIRS